MESNLHPIFQQVLAPFVRPAPTIKQQVRDALAHGSDLVIEHNGDTPVQTLEWVPNEILADAVSRVHK